MLPKNFTVYRSSAGSGKTFTLVKEYLKLILIVSKPGMYRHILAITFTNKATAEMKDRVLGNLAHLSTARKDDFLLGLLSEEMAIPTKLLQKRAAESLSHILHNYSDLSILTIDKFVYKVARSFFLELGLSHNLTVELDGESVLEMAVDSLLEKIGKNPKITQFMLSYLEVNVQKERSWNIESSVLDLSRLLLDEQSHHYVKENSRLDFEQITALLQALKESLNVFEESFSTYIKKGVELTKNIDISLFKGGTRTSIKAYFNRHKSKRKNIAVAKVMPSASLLKAVEEQVFVSPKAKSGEAAIVENISGELQNICQDIIALLTEKGPEYSLYNILEQTLFPMYLLSNIQEELQGIYAQQQTIHLSEFGKKIAKIVNEEPVPFIYERVGEKYRHFLLDEFQDTSTLQWHNMLPLIDESLSKGQKNLLVGDGKQAIYRWRGGEVTQFTQLPQLSSGDYVGHKAAEYQAGIRHNFQEEVLASNWRSSRSIVQFNNQLFEHLKGVLPASLQEIYQNHSQLEQKAEQGFVALQKIAKTEYLQEVYNCIVKVVKEGFSFRDIAILSRSNKELVALSVFLTEKSIAVQSSESLLLKDNTSVAIMLAFLEWYYTTGAKDKRAKLMRAIQGMFSTPIPLSVQHTLVHALSGMEEYLEKQFNLKIDGLRPLSLYELCIEISRKLLPVKGENAFVNALLDLVFHYELKHKASLGGFLYYWEKKQRTASVQSDESSNAVKLMTIHKSKGLEFPVVIVPSVNWSIGITGNKHSYRWVENPLEALKPLKYLLLPLKKELEQTPFSALYTEETAQTLLDNINLLYVAFTRPTKRLYGFYSKEDQLMQFIAPFLQQTAYWDSQKECYALGEEVLEETIKEELEKPLQYMYKPGTWKEKISLSYEHEKAQIKEKTGFGTLIHHLLDTIYVATDIEIVLKKALKMGLIPLQQYDLVLENIQNIVLHPELNKYFQDTVEVHNEYAFFDHFGTLMRADKVVFLPEKTVIIDFKTGKESKAHIKQILAYKEGFWQMGHSNIEGILFYTETSTLVVV